MKLIPLLLIITSCTTNQWQESREYRVTERYSCPDSYIMAKDKNNRLFCVLKDFNQNTIEHKQVKTKPLKQAKKKPKIDCNRLFKQINSCMRG